MILQSFFTLFYISNFQFIFNIIHHSIKTYYLKIINHVKKPKKQLMTNDFCGETALFLKPRVRPGVNDTTAFRGANFDTSLHNARQYYNSQFTGACCDCIFFFCGCFIGMFRLIFKKKSTNTNITSNNNNIRLNVRRSLSINRTSSNQST